MGNEIRLSLLKGIGSDETSFPPAMGAGAPGVPESPAAFLRRFHDSTLPLLRVDRNGVVLDANEAVLLLLDHEIDTVKTLKISDLILRCDRGVMDLIFGMLPLNRPIVIDAICVRRNGSWLSCEVVVPPGEPPSDSEKGVCLWVKEVRNPQEHDTGVLGHVTGFSRAESIEMACVVAGQIAHDFNNLLTPLVAYPELIRHEIKGNTTAIDYLNIIEKTSEDMRRLTQQLLSLARRGRMGSDVFSLNDVINKVLTNQKASIPPEIKVTLDLAPNLLSIMGGREQMKQVIENLVQNAIEAMGSSGTLLLRTENVYLDTPVGTSTTLNVGEYVKITVGDTGQGIPAEIRSRIFDPFFTTKRALKKRGAGLGLSIVHGIVRDHRGYIDFESVPGTGTTFSVYFPITRDTEHKELSLDLPRGVERILVVDDDAPQVEVLSSMLRLLGYKVTGAISGEECINLIATKGYRYDLIILDMVMDPGMDGLETYREVKKTVPDQKVVLISGYARMTQRIAKTMELGAGSYLRKPLAMDILAKAVRDELDRNKPREGIQQTQSPQILIVDDDPMIRKLFAMIILGEFPDAIIDQTSNGDEAISAFAKRRYELIVMDLQMPVRDGREAYVGIEEICRNNGWAIPQVVFCTGFSPPESLQAIIRANPQHCLIRKPVKGDTLVNCVRKLMRS